MFSVGEKKIQKLRDRQNIILEKFSGLKKTFDKTAKFAKTYQYQFFLTITKY